jgi:hypothetical protein
MENNVVVCADPLGNVITPSVNSAYGYVRVEQTVAKIDQQWLRKEKRSALISGLIKDLSDLDLFEGQIIGGKIVIRESLTPFSNTHPERNIKRAGNEGIPCTINNQLIYRQSFYTTNMDETDQLIQHDNTEEIKSTREAEQAISELEDNFTNNESREVRF